MPPPARYCYPYPRPAVTVDLVAFALAGPELRVLLIRRKREPFAGRWAIPGGFLEIDEPIEAAARRELQEETGLAVDSGPEFIGVFGDPGRDPRGRTISFAHAAALRGPLAEVKGGDDAEEAAWTDPRRATGLAFDHDAMLKTALGWLERSVDEGRAGLALLPAEFSRADVAALFRALGRTARSATAWTARLRRQQRIEPIPDGEGRYRAVGG